MGRQPLGPHSLETRRYGVFGPGARARYGCEEVVLGRSDASAEIPVCPSPAPDSNSIDEPDPDIHIFCAKRYEKELNGGSRPALRLITTQDSPASSPMVLCISNIFWSESGVTSDGLAIAACPELEVTDGWYKLRATVDPPLARAIERGAIRVGRKIAVAGAKVHLISLYIFYPMDSPKPCRISVYSAVHRKVGTLRNPRRLRNRSTEPLRELSTSRPMACKTRVREWSLCVYAAQSYAGWRSGSDVGSYRH